MNKVMEPWQEAYIRANAHAMTAPELIRATGLKRACVYSFLTAQDINYKRRVYHLKGKTVGDVINSYGRRGPYKKGGPVQKLAMHVVPEPKQGLQRPPAVYSNHSPFGIADNLK